MSRPLAVAVILALAVGQGCAPLPFASPPLKGSFLVSAVGGTMPLKRKKTKPVAQEEGEWTSPQPMMQGRLGFHPLQLFPSLKSRPFDFGLGYVLEGLIMEDGAGLLDHGAYVELAVYPWQMALSEDSLLRLSVIAQGDLLFPLRTDAAMAGGGGAAGLGLEILTFSDGPLEGEATTGYAYGESSIGLTIMGGYHYMGDTRYWFLGGGLIFRLPASMGVTIVDLTSLGDIAGKAGKKGAKGKKKKRK